MLGLRLLGRPGVLRDGVAVALGTRKALAVLVLLERMGAPVDRATAASLLWPSLDEQGGRRNLRRELARLRDCGVGEAVRIEGNTLALNADVACDAGTFEAAVRAGHPHDALGHWRGPLADGFSLGDADAFDDWLEQQRGRLAELRRSALRSCAAACEAAGDHAAALDHVQALLLDDPLQEQHHRDAMRLLAASGRREAALAQYERCRALLADELGLQPMADTEALAAALRGAAAPVAVAVATATGTGTGVGVGTGTVTADALSNAQASLSSTSAAGASLPEQMPFVGRDDEVARLEAAWSNGRPIVLEGEAGIGKSRLATDFAAAHGPYALARCRAGDVDLPYTSFARAMRALMGGEPALPTLPGWVVGEMARLLPELGNAPPPIRSDEERSRFFEACALAWQALASESFDAVLLDDWHLADASSRVLLAFVARRRSESALAGAREWLLLRPELDADGADALRSLVEATGALHLRLQPLPADSVLTLVRRLSGAAQPVRFAERIGRATGGNPFFLSETLRHLAETGVLSVGSEGGWQTPFDAETDDYRELPVPTSVVDTVLARVQRLPAASRRVLEAAALAAEPFAPALLAPACALSELDTVLAIEAAVAAQLLREHGQGGFAFAHDLVQQALAGSLSDERRRLTHRRLALGAAQAGAPPATIAAHHEASGDPSRAVGHRMAAGDDAERLHALAEATAHWRKALADGPAPAQAIALHERLRHAADRGSDTASVKEQADRLRVYVADASLPQGDRLDAAISRAHALIDAGQPEDGLAQLAALPAQLDPTREARFLRVRCHALQQLGRSADALADAQAALAMPGLDDTDRIELLDLAFASDQQAGRFEAALGHAEATLALASRIGDAKGIAMARFRRGMLRLAAFDPPGAEREMEAAIEVCARCGLLTLQRRVLYNLSCVYSSESRHADALAVIDRGFALRPPIGAGAMRVMYRLGAADSQQALGDLGAAWESARPAIEEAETVDNLVVRLVAARCAFELYGLFGAADEARRTIARLGPDVLREQRFNAGEVWIAWAQFELKEGDPAAAGRALAALDDAGGPSPELRVQLRHRQALAELALATGDAEAALRHLPADDAEGMSDEARTRGLALRVAAEALAGRVEPATLRRAREFLDGPSPHALATLELHTALARASATGTSGLDGEADRCAREQADWYEGLARTLGASPGQETAFRNATCFALSRARGQRGCNGAATPRS